MKLFEDEPTVNPATFEDLPDEEAPPESEKLKLTSHALKVDTLTERQYKHLQKFLDEDRKKVGKKRLIPRFKGVVQVVPDGKKAGAPRVMKLESNGASEVNSEEIK